MTSAELLKYENSINRHSARSFILLSNALDTLIDAIVLALIEENLQSNVA